MKVLRRLELFFLAVVLLSGLPAFAQSFDLTGLWQNPGGSATYRVRQIGNTLYWSVDGTAVGSYANVFFGEISGNTLSGTWVDLPGSPSLGGGSLTLQIQSNDYFIKIGESNLYAAQEWIRQGTTGGLPPARGNIVPLKLFWGAQREDNFSTPTALGEQAALAAGYGFVRLEGYVFPNQELGTVPLSLYWNPDRGDNFSTATPEGERDALGSGYQFVRVEGYVFQTQQLGTVPLKLFWHGRRGDNFTTATSEGERSALAAGYQFVRVEGYVFPSTGGAPSGNTGVTGTPFGIWRLTAIVPPEQPYAGTYTIDITLIEHNGLLSGSGIWSNGVNSHFTGELKNGEIILYRTDPGGFRGTFYGKFRADGQMEGTGSNDPSSPGGNSASYTWTAFRLP
jgi:hypothetical protein